MIFNTFDRYVLQTKNMSTSKLLSSTPTASWKESDSKLLQSQYILT